ncbi:MAG: hypothetical protein SAL70_26990 [Scytonema sp. PMC 1070.18]|nr:hypothetical protein [Scytonema sp. PMC 1070.18]
MENNFFLAVGFWNLIGSVFLYLMLNKTFADKVLRKWTGIITESYDIGKYGSLWLLWAATTNTFFGVINIFAVSWEPSSKVVVIYGDVFVYAALFLPAIVVLSNENYGKGHYVNILLGIFWIVWAVYSLIKM